MVLQEHPHEGRLSAVSIGSATVLYHVVTGEKCKIAGDWELFFNEEGFGYLAPTLGQEGETLWANDILQDSYHREIEDDEEKTSYGEPKLA